jgi:hypothetical protein
MLMDPNKRAVDKDIFEIRIVAERLENPLPDALLRPAPEARIDGEPLAEPFGRSRPRRARARNPKNGFDKEPVVTSTARSFSVFPAICMSTMPQRLDDFALMGRVCRSLDQSCQVLTGPN